jgi:hypothetical protein
VNENGNIFMFYLFTSIKIIAISVGNCKKQVDGRSG